MNTKISSHLKLTNKVIGFLFVLLALLVLSSCSAKDQADDPACYVDMGMRVTIDVTDVKPQVVFDQLAQNPDCAITVSPFVRKHVTLHVENVTVNEVLGRVCPQIGAKYIYNKGHLTIIPFTLLDKWQARKWEEFNRDMAERNRLLQSRLPEGMRFENAALSNVLEEISEASGLVIKPWKGEEDRKVTIDVGGMTVNEALKAIVLQVGGKGAVRIKLSYGFPRGYGQHWLVNMP